MSGMYAFCPKCGSRYYGWALDRPEEQQCEQCGNELKIYRDGVPFRVNHPLFIQTENNIADWSHNKIS